MQIYAKYAVNKSGGEVQLIDGKVRIVVGGWEGLTRNELEHEDIVYAIRRDWIELVDEEPQTPRKPERKPLKLINPQADPNEEFTPKQEAKPAVVTKAEDEVENKPKVVKKKDK